MLIRHYKAGLNFLYQLTTTNLLHQRKLRSVLEKASDYNMYKKSRDFLYVLMIYQHDEAFKIIGVFNYYAFIDLLQRKIIGPRNDAIQLLVIFVTTKA